MHRPRRSIAISTAVSAALHVVPLLAIGWTPRLRWPAPPIPMEVRTPPPRPRAPPPEPRREPPPPKVARAPSGKGPRPKSAGPAKPAPPPLPPPPATADLRPLAPADARVVIVLRTDRLRKSPHKTSVEALLEALPDYRTLLDGTGLTPLDDFEALLIATANPRDVTATFLAARHADDNRLRAALARRTMPEWDPRVFRYLSPRLSVLTRPDGAERIDGASVPDAGADDPRRKWLDDLARFERLTDEPGAPSLLVTVSDLGALVAFGGGLPTPASVALAATSDPAPAVRVTIAFADATEAARFEAEWPAIVGRWRSATLLLGLSSMLDGLAVKREPTSAILDLSGRVPEGQITLALSWAKALIPRPPPEAASPDGGAIVDGGGGGIGAAASDAR